MVTNNFQAIASKQGEEFERDCVMALEVHSFHIRQRKIKLTHIGIEVDIHAENYYGFGMWFECKGSLQGERPGTKRTDTLKKAIGNAYLFSLSPERRCSLPLILFASHVPENGQGLAMIRTVPRHIIYDVLNPWNHSARLKWLYRAAPEQMEYDMGQATLSDILTHRWSIQCKDDQQ